MIVHARAKVNLSLEVDTLRGDGYHPYVSWATSIDWCDTLDVRRVDGAGVSTTTDSGVIDTLATAAVGAVLERAGVDLGVELTITKRIPAGAGLGGGSADAAAAITAVGLLVASDPTARPLDEAALRDVAVGVGTDVPFCRVGGLAELTGRGEIVHGRGALPRIGLLVAVPDVHLSTARVFAEFDRIGPATRAPRVPDWLQALVPKCSFRNDLEPAAHAVAPQLADAKRLIEDCAGSVAFMTGSGSGYIVAAQTVRELEPAAARLRALGMRVHVCEPTPHGVEVVEPG